jgi:hypothetical protein
MESAAVSVFRNCCVIVTVRVGRRLVSLPLRRIRTKRLPGIVLPQLYIVDSNNQHTCLIVDYLRGESQSDGSAVIDLTFNRDRAVVSLYSLFDDCQTEAGSLNLADISGTVK